MNMVANNLPIDPSLDPGGGVKRSNFNFFRTCMVLLHIELKGIANAATCMCIFRPYMHPRTLGWDQSSNTFSESTHVAYQINWNRAYSTMQADILSLPTSSAPRVGSKEKKQT